MIDENPRTTRLRGIGIANMARMNVLQPAAGTPAHGVMASVAYAAGKRVAEVPLDDISEVLKQPGTFVWIGLFEPDEPLLRKVQEEFGLHDLAIEDALTAHQRPKLE